MVTSSRKMLTVFLLEAKGKEIEKPSRRQSRQRTNYSKYEEKHFLPNFVSEDSENELVF